MAKNVVAVLPGSNPDWKQQSMVLSAHYDHLGMGWPDPKKGNENQIHNGADDNASGVAVMLELAEVLKSSAPKRNIVFAAFSAEEAGLRGARHYVKAMQRYPAAQMIGNVNLDTVGRLGNGKLLVLGGASASEWKFIFMGASFVTGVETEMVSQDISASDQVAFIEAGVPAVQLFAGASPDYHQPGDDIDKVDIAGLSKVAAIAREAVVYLAERPEPMHFAGAAKTASAVPPQGGRATRQHRHHAGLRVRRRRRTGRRSRARILGAQGGPASGRCDRRDRRRRCRRTSRLFRRPQALFARDHHPGALPARRCRGQHLDRPRRTLSRAVA